ncbi:unnamed protein product (macronuclear) [Paramecium tetraurelia]|uniref:Phosphodiesterase n=1 Tax=Paramecium tetraurelia TaxID=5888 RepID=A0D8M4_PARTE|nr:uncharacterized protein GSPATT00014337001 [Paramecium tetraurelia]CAK79391.1 unnamed protein product [Paramecium tetraurelia]|eukprot:XP_001446788.1 hypothetical protein (macronuclear) [Paramecium tetraurelia strain d4-2]
MQNNKSATEYLDSIGQQLDFIDQYYIQQADQNDAQVIQKFKKVYKYIDEAYKSNFMNDDGLFSVYGFFLQTVKKFKRKLENRIYFDKTDYAATLEKFERTQTKLVPVYKDLILEAQKQERIDLETLLDSNMVHHIYTKKELGQFALQLFDFLNLDQIKVPKEILGDLINEIVMNYNVVPYHNFTHAFQLSQLLFSCYMKSDLKKFCTQLEIFSAILAGLGHDLNHKGVNNMYKIKKSKKFNILTSEIAVLENMHCATFFNIIQLNRKHDFFQYMSNDEEKTLAKRLIITSILATDMSKHAKLLAKLQKRVECTKQYDQGEKNDLIEMQRFSNERLEDRIFILNIMVHACDISNPTMKFNNYMNWSYLLTQEFNDQTIKEAKIGVDVTGFLIYKDKPTYYGGQMFFSKSLVLPLWVQIGELYPELKYLSEEINKNLEILQQKLKQ